ncbi:MetQ/NlpA family ABC transporter substrate-binding protein [Providencia vermicola]|jgi:D-methionine transport system substrate-binding protein|uniref:MetQ/NlpA family ABC transporter substrate-binding protein n=1 Tax=Providencia TaxID=586 RepID=UPI00197CB5FD|nr:MULTISPECIES: MetQ/NlpA family ABC transporter substrate-binding protein [Providencia]MDR2226592.1 methionine ABC transporter substrate-binding protein [Providencia sp.]ELR5150031.1 methionine ABC transporter substrate-binding protein [Providencia rettgeri]MBN4864733.1 methionine ABC transporter substrate-binding protein [Providencia stuartii]MBN4873821.1 methionine ABC transporter substrate-binding protein [Providencia stuartii]MBN4878512.1 methionine ABC transporter substrate-binding prot
MKLSLLTRFGALLITSLALTACQPDQQEKSNKLTIGASSTPHAEILEFVKPQLEKDGINLDIRVFNDYIIPNQALADKELDANFFQHVPYLNKTLADHPDWKLVSVGAVHMHPYRFFSQKHKSLQDLPNGAKVLSSNNISQHGHILKLYQDEGLIKLRSDIDPDDATIDDIVENPRNLQFLFTYDAPLMPQIYKNGEADVASIDSHFAINAGLDLTKDVIYSEPAANSKFANVVVTREDNQNDPRITKLMAALKSDETKKFILDNYKGEAVPVP